MKINEIMQPSSKAIFESLSNDTDHTFSEETLMEISENIAHAKFVEVNDVEAWMESLKKRYG